MNTTGALENRMKKMTIKDEVAWVFPLVEKIRICRSLKLIDLEIKIPLYPSIAEIEKGMEICNKFIQLIPLK